MILVFNSSISKSMLSIIGNIDFEIEELKTKIIRLQEDKSKLSKK